MLKMMTPMTMLILSLIFLPNSWALATASLLILSFISITLMPSQLMSPSYISMTMMTDSLSTPLISLSIWISALMLLASYKEKLNKNKPKKMTAYVISLLIILTIAFSSTNMMMFYIFFEASLIPTMLLIMGWGYQPERLQASTYLILYTITASLPLLISLLLIYSSPTNLLVTLTQWEITPSSMKLTTMWWMMTILAFLTKMPLYMFHLWLPKAHVEAPVAGSMVLAGILLKLGSYGLMRLSSMMIKMNQLISSPMMSLSLCGATLTSLICLRQTDLKSLIAYSSIGHMSLLMAGLLSNSSWGWNAALTMMLAHGLCSSSLFALANMTYESTQTRSIFLTKGLMTAFPTLTMWWFMNCAMNMAAPPSSSLLSELFLIMGTLPFSIWTAPTLAIMVFLGAAYSLHLYTSSQHGSMPSFSSPMNLLTQRNYLVILLHLLPALVLTTKPEIIMTWT